jgi:hypothetical protein
MRGLFWKDASVSYGNKICDAPGLPLDEACREDLDLDLLLVTIPDIYKLIKTSSYYHLKMYEGLPAYDEPSLNYFLSLTEYCLKRI